MKTMKTSLLKMLLGAMCAAVMAGLAVSASGATVTYNYTEGGLDGSAWTAKTYAPASAPDTWENVFAYANSGTSFSYTGSLPDGYDRTANYRAALVWTAPANEVITGISLNYKGNRANGTWDPVIYRITSGETLSGTTLKITNNVDTTQWEPNWTPFSFNYDRSNNIQGIGIGFDTMTAWGGWYIDYGSIVITTTIVPEPASMALLALGALPLLRRRR